MIGVAVGADALGRPGRGERQGGGDQPFAAAVEVQVDLHGVAGLRFGRWLAFKVDGYVDPGFHCAELGAGDVEIGLIVHHLSGERPLVLAEIEVIGNRPALRGQGGRGAIGDVAIHSARAAGDQCMDDGRDRCGCSWFRRGCGWFHGGRDPGGLRWRSRRRRRLQRPGRYRGQGGERLGQGRADVGCGSRVWQVAGKRSRHEQAEGKCSACEGLGFHGLVS